MNLSIEFYYYLILASTLLVLIFFFFRTLKMLKKKKVWASCRNSSYLLLVLFFLVTISLVGTNILTYHRLTHERPIAYIHIKHLNKQSFQMNLLLLENCHKSSYILQGDEWQMDARIIKWHGWANLLGLDASYQLDRVSGRYQNIKQQRMNLPTVFALESLQDYDLWALKKEYQWLPLLDAKYGQSVFLPMKNNLSYQLYMTQVGIIAREIKASSFISENCSQ
ncbi:MAG: hypothetical protein OQL19_17135 [Gammaproteobacteria bacterium]|nr:hypothetical protein [Gammaproteobacteria bacterium]